MKKRQRRLKKVAQWWVGVKNGNVDSKKVAQWWVGFKNGNVD